MSSEVNNSDLNVINSELDTYFYSPPYLANYNTYGGFGDISPFDFFEPIPVHMYQHFTNVDVNVIDRMQTACPDEPSLFLEGVNDIDPVEKDLTESDAKQAQEMAKHVSHNFNPEIISTEVREEEMPVVVNQVYQKESDLLETPLARNQKIRKIPVKRTSLDNITDKVLVPRKKYKRQEIHFRKIKN